jgi:hypothetical protein
MGMKRRLVDKKKSTLQVSENKPPRKYVDLGRMEYVRNTELRCLSRSPTIVRLVKSRRLQCVWNVARMGETNKAYRILVGNLLRNVHLQDRKGEGKRILRWIVRR